MSAMLARAVWLPAGPLFNNVPRGRRSARKARQDNRKLLEPLLVKFPDIPHATWLPAPPEQPARRQVQQVSCCLDARFCCCVVEALVCCSLLHNTDLALTAKLVVWTGHSWLSGADLFKSRCTLHELEVSSLLSKQRMCMCVGGRRWCSITAIISRGGAGGAVTGSLVRPCSPIEGDTDPRVCNGECCLFTHLVRHLPWLQLPNQQCMAAHCSELCVLCSPPCSGLSGGSVIMVTHACWVGMPAACL